MLEDIMLIFALIMIAINLIYYYIISKEDGEGLEEEKEIKKLTFILLDGRKRPPNNQELMDKLNEVIDEINEIKKEM